MLDFLSLLNDTNSVKNDETGEITITASILQTNGKFSLTSSCNITSNCNTTIKSEIFEITGSSISISYINFQTSILIEDANNISMKKCTLTKSKSLEGAFSICNSKNVTLSNITINDTVDIPGIFIYRNSYVTADNLLMHDLNKTFVAVNGGSFLSITDSVFHHSKGNSFYVASQSSIEIFNCSISYTEYPALFIRDSQCVVKSSTFQNTAENAISIHSSPDFLIEKNTISQVKDTAIQISNESTGIIKNNSIYDVEGNGIYSNNSILQIKDNEIFDLVYPAIAIATKSKASLIGNKVYNVKYSGICIRNAKEVTIENSQIKNINETGISISDTDKCVIKNNQITNCDINSIEAYNRSNVFIDNNIISHIGKHAFNVFASGYMKAENNKINDVKDGMVKMSYKGGGDFINNRITNCLKQKDCQTSSFYFLAKNGDFKNVTNDPSRLSNDNLITLEDSYAEKDDLCIKCKKKKRNCYLLHCGHKAYCQECAELALKNGEKCPLCRFPIMSVSNGFGINNDDSCIICCENHADCIILPCGHMGTCSTCLENWFNSSQSCPICRAEPCIYKQVHSDI